MYPYSSHVWKILACPYCEHSLVQTSEGAMCTGCRAEYGCNASGALDLRLEQPKEYNLEIELGTPLRQLSGLDLAPLPMDADAEVDFIGFGVPHHLTRELMSHFPMACGQDSMMLDLGCGSGLHKGVCEHAGFEYVGLDHESPKAMLLGDAHALPFADASFEFVLSVAVLEHIRFPLVMMRETYRVLKPHGRFIGTVAFLEPFHADSYYHHTHLGLLNLLEYGGFEVRYIAPSKDWTALTALAKALLPGMPPVVRSTLTAPIRAAHEVCRLIAQRRGRSVDEHLRLCTTTGAFAFVAVKG